MVLARPERFELPTPWFVARYSIQLSYGRAGSRGARILPHRTPELPELGRTRPWAARR